MGISVSVDSWVQQTVEEITAKSYPRKNSIYKRLISSASFPSEIFVVESEYFAALCEDKCGNLQNVVTTCLEELVSNDSLTQLNSAALLLRIMPFLCKPKSPINFEDFCIGQTQIFGKDTCPGAHIVNVALSLLNDFPVDDAKVLFDMVNGHMPIFDLLGFVIFVMLKEFHNPTLYHQMIISIQTEMPNIINVLFNYVFAGGRHESIIGLLTLLMFHPSGSFDRHTAEFLNQGGELSTKLVQIENNDTDLMCMLCAVAIKNDDARPSLQTTDRNLLRLGLIKDLMGKTVQNTPEDILTAYQTSESPLARIALMKVPSCPPDIQQQCPPLTDSLFLSPHDSDEMIQWIPQGVAHLFMYHQSYLFKGTGLRHMIPAFDGLDSLVIQTNV